AGTSKKVESPACNSTASAPSQPVSQSSSSAGTRRALVHSETLRKRIRSPDVPKLKFVLPQGSPGPALHPSLSSSKKEPSCLPGTAEKVALKQRHVPAKCKPVPVAKTKVNSLAPRATQLPVTNLRAVAKFAHSQQLLTKTPENPIQVLRTGSHHPQKAPQTASDLSKNLKSASALKHSASAPSLAVRKVSKSPSMLVPTSKNVSSAVNKQPNVNKLPQPGSASSKLPERTPLSVVRLPQTAAKATVTKNQVKPSTKGQSSAKNLQANESLAPAAKKPLPKGKSAMMCNKGMPAASNGPLTKNRQDDHYFVMTGSKKSRK
ncbi:GA2L3 protein, partial [Centropus bengalensis]|nr:GA2L3 protein [Centropus bengalensis]